MKNYIVFSFAIFLAIFSSVTLAQPATRWVLNPSSIFIFATNDENRGYNCSINISWSHQNGDVREFENTSTTSFVHPKSRDAQIFSITGSFIDIQVQEKGIQCIGA